MSSTEFMERRRQARRRLRQEQRQQQQQQEEQAGDDENVFEFRDDANRDEFEFDPIKNNNSQRKRKKLATSNRSLSPTSFSSLVRYSSKVYSDDGGATKRKRSLVTTSAAAPSTENVSKTKSRNASKLSRSSTHFDCSLTTLGANGVERRTSLSSSSSSSLTTATTNSDRVGSKEENTVHLPLDQEGTHKCPKEHQSRTQGPEQPDSDKPHGDADMNMLKVSSVEKTDAVGKKDNTKVEGRSNGAENYHSGQGQSETSTASGSVDANGTAEQSASLAKPAQAATTTAIAVAAPPRLASFGKKHPPSVLRRRATWEDRSESIAKSPRPVVRFSFSPSKSVPDASSYSSSNNQNSTSAQSKDFSSTASHSNNSGATTTTPTSLLSTRSHSATDNSHRGEPLSSVNTATPSSFTPSCASLVSDGLPKSVQSSTSSNSSRSSDSSLMNLLPRNQGAHSESTNESKGDGEERKRQRPDEESQQQQQQADLPNGRQSSSAGSSSSASSSNGPLKRLKRGNSVSQKSQAPNIWAVEKQSDDFIFLEEATDGASAVTVSSSQLSRSSSFTSTEKGRTRSRRQQTARRQRYGRKRDHEEEQEDDWDFGLESHQETTEESIHQEAPSIGADSLSSASEWDVPVVTNVRGAGTDAFAVQDAGSYRMLKDDCAYLCSTILTAISRHQGEPGQSEDMRDDASTAHSQSSSQTVHLRRFMDLSAEAACDLALMLSSSRTRAGLLLPVDNGDKASKEDDEKADSKQRRRSAGGDDILRAVLDVLACAPKIDPLFQGAASHAARDAHDVHTDSQQDVWSHSGNLSVSSGVVGEAQQLPNNKKMGRTRSGRRKLAAVGRLRSVDKDADDNGSVSAASANHHVASSSVADDTYNHVASRALGFLAHFVSLDCTMTTPSSASVSAVAMPGARRRVRRCMLEHGGCLRGLARLIVADRTVGEILAPKQQSVERDSRASIPAPAHGPPLFVETNDEYDDVGESQRSSLSISSFESPFDLAPFPADEEDDGNEEPLSQSSIGSEIDGDPTKSGRRNRRARRSKRPRVTEHGRFSLDAITENPNPDRDNDHAVDSDDDDVAVANSQHSTVHPETDELTESHLQPTRKSDPVSYAALPRLESKLEKLAAATNIAGEDRTADATTSSHEPCKLCPKSCRRTHKAIDPGIMALRALHRILIGKDVNDSDGDGDAADDGDTDDAENKEDAGDEGSEQEASNPLVMTNEMLARSSAIPLVAQAMTWTLSALASVIQLSLQADDTVVKPKREDAFAFEDQENSDNNEVEKGRKTDLSEKITNICPFCVGHLRGRVMDLAVIIDRACCFHDENRQQLCAIPTGENNDSLPVGLIKFAVSVALPPHGHELPFNQFLLHDDVCDVLLSALRTLTSLTHENEVAAQQFLTMFTLETNVALTMTGVEGIMKLLFALVSLQQAEGGTAPGGRGTTTLRHHWYDMTIFCLNILTNTLESECAAAIRREIYSIEWHDRRPSAELSSSPRKRQFALSWLAKWVASQTDSYRRAMMKGTFGKVTERKSEDATSPSKLALRRIDSKTGNERDLKKSEEESLVVAGNGFIFLACLMREEGSGVSDSEGQSQSSFSSQTTVNVRNRILSEMPADLSILGGCSTPGKGVDLMIRTLKAFCNFYHYSLGDLSVAVVTPVVKIISDLETIGKEEVQGKVLSHVGKAH